MKELFKIYKVDIIEAKRIINSINQPHKHNFEELIIGLKGEIRHFIDFKSQKIQSPFVSFVTQGKIHQVAPEVSGEEYDLWVIRFKREFIPEITFDLYNFYHDNANFNINQTTAFKKLDILCSLIFDEYNSETPELAVIRNLLISIFSIIEVDRKKSGNDIDHLIKNQNTTFSNFLSILEDNYRRTEGVNFYAEKLFMTPKSLNTITQNILHMSVSEMIELRKLTEAKKLLFTTEKTISEIGYDIGYTDKAYFTSVFKKKTGITPTEFRDEMKNLLG